MKTAILCAIIFSQIAAEGRELTPVKSVRCVRPSSGVLSPGPVALARRQLPAPVGEMVQPNGRVVEGVLLRVATAPQRMQMINPVAPPEYGSASELVVFSADPNRTDNRNRPPTKAQPIGLRLLTVRSFW